MSLRLRFAILPILVVLGGAAGLALAQAWDARDQVRAEAVSNVQMGRLLAAGAITHATRAATAQESFDLLARELPPSVGDLRLRFEPGGVSSPSAGARAMRGEAPAEFTRLVAATPVVERYPVIVAGAPVGSVVLTVSSDKAVLAAWTGWTRAVAVIALVAGLIILSIILAASLALSPLTALTRAFDRLERGDLAVRVKGVSDPRLRRLGERFNRLAAGLEQAAEDRRLLLDQAASANDVERNDIARELHDGYGPPLFAIRSDLGAISRWVRKKEPRFEEIEERLLSISGLVAQIQRLNSQLLERLRRP